MTDSPSLFMKLRQKQRIEQQKQEQQSKKATTTVDEGSEQAIERDRPESECSDKENAPTSEN